MSLVIAENAAKMALVSMIPAKMLLVDRNNSVIKESVNLILVRRSSVVKIRNVTPYKALVPMIPAQVSNAPPNRSAKTANAPQAPPLIPKKTKRPLATVAPTTEQAGKAHLPGVVAAQPNPPHPWDCSLLCCCLSVSNDADAPERISDRYLTKQIGAIPRDLWHGAVRELHRYSAMYLSNIV